MKMDLGIAAAAAQQRRWAMLAFGLAALLAVAAAAIHPIGYVGAGSDDEQYLAAARCWAAHGPCVPTSHWWTRWPLVAPLAAFISLLGESRVAVQLAPGLWWAVALAATGWLGTAWFGWRSGALALALLGTAPAVAFDAFGPNIDIPELALQLTALAAATIACRRQSPFIAALAGLLAGCAVQARETSLLFVGACALMWFTLSRDKRKVLLWAAPGFVFAEIAEVLAYALATGDPLLRLRLAMAHTSIPTNQLPDGFHSSRGPLLNPDYIRSWKHEMHIAVWWPIDPWLNLYASPLSGMLLASGSVAAATLVPQLALQQRRNALRLIGGGAIIALGLVYLLAIDPKTRMFMGLYAAFALAAGAAIAHALRGPSRPLAATLALLPLLGGLYVMSQYTTSAPAEAWARQWIQRYPRDIEIFPGAASYLTFVPEARALPPTGSGRRYMLTTVAGDCRQLIGTSDGHPNGVLVDQFSSRLGRLCLFEYLPVRPSSARER